MFWRHLGQLGNLFHLVAWHRPDGMSRQRHEMPNVLSQQRYEMPKVLSRLRHVVHWEPVMVWAQVAIWNSPDVG